MSQLTEREREYQFWKGMRREYEHLAKAAPDKVSRDAFKTMCKLIDHRYGFGLSMRPYHQDVPGTSTD